MTMAPVHHSMPGLLVSSSRSPRDWPAWSLAIAISSVDTACCVIYQLKQQVSVSIPHTNNG